MHRSLPLPPDAMLVATPPLVVASAAAVTTTLYLLIKQPPAIHRMIVSAHSEPILEESWSLGHPATCIDIVRHPPQYNDNREVGENGGGDVDMM